MFAMDACTRTKSPLSRVTSRVGGARSFLPAALLWSSGTVQAAPLRGPRVFPPAGAIPVEDAQGRRADMFILKLAPGTPLRLMEGQLVPSGEAPLSPRERAHWQALVRALADVPVERRFSRPYEDIARDRKRYDPKGQLGDLNLYFRVSAAWPADRLEALARSPLVETAYPAFAPVPPPVDIPPETPDFTEQQGYRDPAPDGLGFDEAPRWPGGDGANVAVVDIEYGWEQNHEDLDAATDAFASGWNSGAYAYHGTAVLGQLVAGDNGYGVTGLVPAAEPLVVSPYDSGHVYDVADAIDRSAALLDAGDVILIEQQSWMFGNYCPVEVDQGVFDAISQATARGIVVVEPAGNGAQDLDDPRWDGIFDREIRDSGAILVGGGASPESGFTPRSWYPSGSCYGSRIDVQAWYDGIVTTINGDYGGYYADLYYPDEDGLQAYTTRFGGTSGASPMVTAVAAAVQSVAWEIRGAPLSPEDLRAMMISTGTPQPESSTELIGPQPDLRRLMRTYLVP